MLVAMPGSINFTVPTTPPPAQARRGRSTSAAALADLHTNVRRCRRCALCHTRTHAVPGVGSLTTRVVLIGEAPGREEDERGEPFVGRSGRVLNQLLDEVGLRRDDVYITNVVKCRPVEGVPPGRNRAPTKAEIETCAPWLDAQLRMLNPEVIVTLGQIALSRILPGERVGEVHGRALRDGAKTVLPLYHPAMARYGPKWVALLRRDFRRLVPILQRQERSEHTPKRSSRKK